MGTASPTVITGIVFAARACVKGRWTGDDILRQAPLFKASLSDVHAMVRLAVSCHFKAIYRKSSARNLGEHMQEANRKITLKSRPSGYPQESDFELVEERITQPGEGEVLIKSIWLSLDPHCCRERPQRGVYVA